MEVLRGASIVALASIFMGVVPLAMGIVYAIWPSEHRLALTGTPIENRLSEIWSIFDFVAPSLLGELSRFEEKFARPIDRGDKNAAEKLRAAIHRFVLRRDKVDVAKDLPPKIEQDILVPMADDQTKLYAQILRQVRESVMSELRRHFRPEFLNRVDDIVLFKPLTETEIEHIVELMFDDLRTRLADRRMTVTLTEAARRFIAEQGFDPVYGARPLRRFIAHEVETRIARALVAGDVPDGSEIRIDVLHDELQVSFQPGAPAIAA